MNIVNYLTEIYGYDTPIFIKDVRIGRKSKTAIREEFYRATKRGELERKSSGVYLVRSNKEFGSGITFNEIIESKYIYSDNISHAFKELFVEGYYSGLTFLNMIGISEQVPAMPEVTTNKTSSKKRYYFSGDSVAIVRKARTTVTSQNYKELQFFDMFHFLSLEEIKKNKDLIINYVKKNGIGRYSYQRCIKFYGPQTLKKLVEGGIVDAFI